MSLKHKLKRHSPPRTRNASVDVYIPSGLDWSDLVRRYPPAIPFNVDVVALLLDTIIRRIDPASPHSFVNLKGQYLRECHRDYAEYLEWLQTAGIIECDHRYVVGRKSYGYRLTSPYRANGVITYRLRTGTSINAYNRKKALATAQVLQTNAVNPIRFLSNERAVKPRQLDKLVLINPHSDQQTYPFSSFLLLNPPKFPSPSIHRFLLLAWYNYDAPIVDEVMTRVAPDLWTTMRHLSESLNQVTLDGGWREEVDNVRQQRGWSRTTAERERRRLLRLEADLQHGTSRFTRNTTNGRLDTALTNISKEFRQFLRFDGSAEWVQLDVQTAQPYLVLRLLQDRNARRDIADKWAAAVCHADVYTALAADLKVNRQAAKECWFKLVFAHNNANSPAKDAFEARFPELADVFAREKRIHHRDLAVRLQTYESHVMLERIAPRLGQLGIPVLTIHDSFIVPAANATVVERIMSEELTAYTGYPAVIRREGPIGCEYGRGSSPHS